MYCSSQNYRLKKQQQKKTELSAETIKNKNLTMIACDNRDKYYVQHQTSAIIQHETTTDCKFFHNQAFMSKSSFRRSCGSVSKSVDPKTKAHSSSYLLYL